MRPAATRREVLQASTALAGSLLARPALGRDEPAGKALIAITLDLEMSRHYPTWDQTHWDYEKGNLDQASKDYALKAARFVKSQGGVIHFFLVGRVLEQADVGWLEEIIRDGHPVGNHSYDHVNVKATKVEQIQFRFQRAPWLIEGKSPAEIISENIRLTRRAMKQRLGIEPAGFRTPGGFSDGLVDRSDVQRMLSDQGYSWVSSKYPAHPLGKPGEPPGEEVFQAILAAQTQAQPFRYASGLVEVPMNPISDVTAFRAGRWGLEPFLKAIDQAVRWAIGARAVFDFLAHPSCLGIVDPELRTIRLICDLVRQAGPRAAIVDLGTIARRAGGED